MPLDKLLRITLFLLIGQMPPIGHLLGKCPGHAPQPGLLERDQSHFGTLKNQNILYNDTCGAVEMVKCCS
jgi:hypothetical protein